MHDALIVRGFQRGRNLLRNTESFFKWNRTFSDPLRQRRALDVLHDEVVRTDIVERADIGVVQSGDGAGFTFESIGELLRRNFDGDIAAQTRVPRFPHLTHPAFTYGRGDFIRA
jgi:hypothetical protein